MKFLYTLFFLFGTICAYATSSNTFNKLCEVNKCWTEQTDVHNLPYHTNTNMGEREWIRTHLQLVEQTLRKISTANLSETQKANRQDALNKLNSYWKSGAFPVNDLYNYRTPIFIDRYDNFCAVGYLVKATGHEAISRKIAAATNLAYVREMNYPELNNWAKDYGFTVDELAWIQPSYIYTPRGICNAVGKGTDGEVFELFVDKTGEKLFVGGMFSAVDSTITANSIAYITDSNNKYTWHGMGGGVDGTVYAVAEHQNKIFIAGVFGKSGTTSLDNVAYWDGTKWTAAGCLDGIVKDLAVMNNELYACGDFNMCDGTQDVNFAKWTGTGWQPISGLLGRVNTMHVDGTEMILGGYFNFSGTNTNIIKWYQQYGFIKYSNQVDNEVMDIEPHKGTYYLSCRGTISSANMIYYRSGLSLWVSTAGSVGGPAINSYNTLCAEQDSLWMGGDFYDYPPMPRTMGGVSHISYTSNITKSIWWSDNAFYLNGPVNKFVLYKGALIGAGKFSQHIYGKQLNHIFYRAKAPVVPPPPPVIGEPPYNHFTYEGSYGEESTSIIDNQTAVVSIAPNPLKSGGELQLSMSNTTTLTVEIIDMTGKVILNSKLQGSSKFAIRLPEINAGMYMVQLTNESGNTSIHKLNVF